MTKNLTQQKVTYLQDRAMKKIFARYFFQHKMLLYKVDACFGATLYSISSPNVGAQIWLQKIFL